jgi:hypothetical protein
MSLCRLALGQFRAILVLLFLILKSLVRVMAEGLEILRHFFSGFLRILLHYVCRVAGLLSGSCLVIVAVGGVPEGAAGESGHRAHDGEADGESLHNYTLCTFRAAAAAVNPDRAVSIGPTCAAWTSRLPVNHAARNTRLLRGL